MLHQNKKNILPALNPDLKFKDDEKKGKVDESEKDINEKEEQSQKDDKFNQDSTNLIQKKKDQFQQHFQIE